MIDWAEARLRSTELLARVGLREDPDTPIKEIGVGKQQLVEIAKALNKSVKLLILDEPTAALNESDSQHLLDLMLGLKGRGITSIIISHKLNEIEQIADSITIIRDGKSIETLNVKADGVDEDRIIKGMVGRTLESRFPDHEPKIGEVFFEVKNWTVGHPQIQDRLVCKNSNFFVRRGEIVGLRRADGRRPDRTGPLRVRPFLRPLHLRPGLQGRQGSSSSRTSTRPSTPASATSPRTASPSA